MASSMPLYNSTEKKDSIDSTQLVSFLNADKCVKETFCLKNRLLSNPYYKVVKYFNKKSSCKIWISSFSSQLKCPAFLI